MKSYVSQRSIDYNKKRLKSILDEREEIINKLVKDLKANITAFVRVERQLQSKEMLILEKEIQQIIQER